MQTHVDEGEPQEKHEEKTRRKDEWLIGIVSQEIGNTVYLCGVLLGEFAYLVGNVRHFFNEFGQLFNHFFSIALRLT